MWQLGTPPLDLVLRSAIVYVAFILGLRVFGKREVGQFTLFDPRAGPPGRQRAAAGDHGA